MNHQGGEGRHEPLKRGRETGLLLYVLVMSTRSTWAEPCRVFGIKYRPQPWYGNWCGNWYGKLTVCSDASHLTLAMFVHQQTLTTHNSVAHQLTITYVISHTACGA